MKKVLIVVIIIVVLVLAYFVLAKNPAKAPVEAPDTSTEASSTDATTGKLNIDTVCEAALSYMTFPDAASADAFVAECKAGEHPEVIEHYKEQMNVGDGAAI